VALASAGVLANPVSRTVVRFVTHADLDDEDVAVAAVTIREIAARTAPVA
jgi:threonine aldolase